MNIVKNICMWLMWLLTGIESKELKKIDEEYEKCRENFYRDLDLQYGKEWRKWGNCL